MCSCVPYLSQTVLIIQTIWHPKSRYLPCSCTEDSVPDKHKNMSDVISKLLQLCGCSRVSKMLSQVTKSILHNSNINAYCFHNLITLQILLWKPFPDFTIELFSDSFSNCSEKTLYRTSAKLMKHIHYKIILLY